MKHLEADFVPKMAQPRRRQKPCKNHWFLQIFTSQEYDFSSIFDIILGTPWHHFGASWGGHVTDKVTFLELQRASKNELEFDVHEEGAQIESIAILMRLGSPPRPQKCCKIQGI